MARKKATTGAKSSAPSGPAKDKKTADSPRTRRQRQYRLSLGGNTRSQKTLTQINFVNRPSKCDSLNDLDLEYIEEEAEEDDAFFASTASAMHKQKRRRSAGKTKTVEHADTTLTQMGCSIVHDNNDDTGLPLSTQHRAYETGKPQKRSASSLWVIGEETQCDHSPDSEQNHDVLPKRRRMSHPKGNRSADQPDQLATCQGDNKLDSIPSELPRSSISFTHGVTESQTRRQDNPLGLPVTPKRPQRHIVLSSQSPESPEVTFIKMNRINTPSRLPLRSKSTNKFLDPFPDNPPCGTPSPKRESLSPMSTQGDFSLPPPIETVLESPNIRFLHRSNRDTRESLLPSSPLSARPSPEAPSKSFLNEVGLKPRAGSERPVSSGSTRSRRTELVVYETDGETDDDEIYQTTSPPTRRHDDIPTEPIVRDPFPKPSSGELDSQLTETAPDTESLPTASLLYARHYSSYPYEKYMGTLLPEETTEISQSNIETQSEIIEPSLPSAPPRRSQRLSTQQISNPMDDISTESIPESQLQQDNPELLDSQPPPSTAAVIHVESSQQPTNIIESDDSEQQSGPRGILTASQLLPDSLMDSIPAPPGWMSSQALDTDLNDP